MRFVFGNLIDNLTLQSLYQKTFSILMTIKFMIWEQLILYCLWWRKGMGTISRAFLVTFTPRLPGRTCQSPQSSAGFSSSLTARPNAASSVLRGTISQIWELEGSHGRATACKQISCFLLLKQRKIKEDGRVGERKVWRKYLQTFGNKADDCEPFQSKALFQFAFLKGHLCSGNVITTIVATDHK